MKVALILARREEDLDQYPPLGLGYLAAVLKRRFPDLELTYCRSEREAARLKTDLALVSASSANYGIAIRVAGLLTRRTRAPVLVGGVHVSPLPESLDRAFDAGVVGEGEVTLVEWLDAWLREGRIDAAWMRVIPGLVYHGPSGRVLTAERELVRDLDSLPHPDRGFLGYRGGPAHLMTSRGCPYRCSFCSSSAHWKTYRTFSVEYVMEEIDELVRTYGTRQVHLYDDLFVANAERLRQFAALYQLRGYPDRLAASCAVRANLVDEEAAGLLARMKFARVTFGAESASDAVLCTLKSSVTARDNERAVRLCHGAGLRVGLSFIVGSPEERKDDLVATYLFILREIYAGRIDQADVNVLTPFPATPLWDVAREKGLVGEDMDWDRLHAPWRDLVVNQTLRREGVRAFLYDLRVRRMLERFRTPITAVVPSGQVTAEDRAKLDELARRDNLLTGLVLMGEPFGEAPPTASRAWWPIAEMGPPAILGQAESAGAGPGVRPIYLLLSRPKLLVERPDVVRYLSWVHFEDENDLTTMKEYSDILACSHDILDVLLESGWPDGNRAADQFPGFRAREIRHDPGRYAFDRDVFPDPLPDDLVFRELIDFYSRLSAERLLFANAESGLRGELAERDRALQALADRLGDPGPAPPASGSAVGRALRSLLRLKFR